MLAYLAGIAIAAIILNALTGYLMERLRAHAIAFCAIALLCGVAAAYLSPFSAWTTVAGMAALVVACGIVRAIAFALRWHDEAAREEDGRLEPC